MKIISIISQKRYEISKQFEKFLVSVGSQLSTVKNDNIVHSKSAHSKKKENRQKMPYLSNEKYIEKMPTILNLPGTKAISRDFFKTKI